MSNSNQMTNSKNSKEQTEKNSNSPKLNIKTIQAGLQGGEMVMHSIPALGGLLPQEFSPIRYILNSIKRFFHGIRALFKNKKLLIPIILLTVVWVVLAILNAQGVEHQAIRILNFLTLSQLGTGQEASNILGGIAGKGLFAYLITTTMMRLGGNKQFNFGFGGIKVLFGSLRFRKNNSLTPLLFGSGIALIAYNFMSGEMSPASGMAAITGFILSLRALTGNAGFIKGLLRSILSRFSRGGKTGATANYVLSGLSTGFLISLPFSYVPYGITGYIAGAALIIFSIIIKLVSGRKKEVPTE